VQTVPSKPVAPVITNSYAIQKERYGEVLKIYIEANDSEGDMLRIATVVEHTGYSRYPVDWVYLKPEHGRHFLGHLQWNTFSSNTARISEWTQVTLKVSVFDRAGNESNVVVFPLEFVSEVVPHPPLPFPFGQGDIPRLGHVNVDLFETWRDGP
jgi:hypothetical protein